jgi:O-antigen/teichoic acid export membrane protein
MTSDSELRLGIFVYGLSVLGPMVVLGGLELRNVLVSDAQRRIAFRDLFGVRVISMLLVVVAAGCVAYARPPQGWSILVLLALIRSVYMVSELLHAVFQRAERMGLIASSQLLRGIAGTGGFLLALLFAGQGPQADPLASLEWGCVTLLVVHVLVLMLFDVPVAARILRDEKDGRRASLEGMRRVVWGALPLAVATGLVVLNTNIPRYVVEHRIGERELGIFVAVSYVLIAMAMLCNALTASTLPRMSVLWSAGDQRGLRKLAIRVLTLCFVPLLPILPVAYFFGGPLMALAYRPEFASHVDLLMLFVLIGLASCVIGGLRAILTACQAFRVQLWLSVPALLITIVASFLWIDPTIPDQSMLWQAGLVVLASRLFMLVSHASYVAWRLRPRTT